MSSAVPLTRTLPALLRRELDAIARGRARLIVAQVTAVPSATRVTVTIGGSATQAPRLASYSPTVGDTVYCLAQGSVLIVLGKVAS